MLPADIALLERLAIIASTTPCTVARADLLRLIDLAGLRGFQIWMDVEGGGDPMTVLPDGLREMIKMAREAGNAPRTGV